jgi:hypothetical protein
MAPKANRMSAGPDSLRHVTEKQSAELGVAGELLHYLQQARDGMLSSLDGLSDYDIRRPLTPAGTNLLGLVKHLASIEFAYLGDCVGRPAPIRLPGSRMARSGTAPTCGPRPASHGLT